MNQYCVVVANGTNARFFSLEDPDIPELQSGPNLVLQSDLNNSELSSHNQELWTDSKSGGNRGHGGKSHGYDDHRSQHTDEIEKRFANSIADECNRLRNGTYTHIVLVSPPRMLGHLRQACDSNIQGVSTSSLAKDLNKMGPIDLHQHLSNNKLIPERRKPQLAS